MKTMTTTFATALLVAIVRSTAAQTGAQAPVAPRFLSETGLYSDVATLKIDERNRRFSPQYPLWSDGATKQRWVQLPAGSRIDVSRLERWELPVGTRFWKEFAFKGKKVETRFLWRVSKDRWVLASYAWNAQQTNAERVSEDGVANIAEIADGKRHSIPSVSECRSCHDSDRTEALGFTALQLSDDRDPNALHAEPLADGMLTLRTLVEDDLITPPRVDVIAAPPRIQAASPITRTALGYLSTNCGSCHNREGSIASLGLNLNYQMTNACAPLTSTINQRGHWVVPEAQEASRVINPGHPESSAIIRRVKSRRPISQMPAIGTVIVDQEAVDLLSTWVEQYAEELKQAVERCASQQS